MGRAMSPDARPKLVRTLRNELAENLSGGQKKLLELGRTMMTDARLVLLDEPGAGDNPTLLGKLADMIVVAGDPLKSISAIRDVELVVRGGYAFDPAGIRID